MSRGSERRRGTAYEGKGYGTRRRLLFQAARRQIERSIKEGFFCEAIALSESVIADRLESRLSWLTSTNVGFKTLGSLINKLRRCETDPELTGLLGELDGWRKRRNGALHEMVKIADDGPVPDWQTRKSDWTIRMAELAASANVGYELLKRLYHRVADLNPRHRDRVFPNPESRQSSMELGAAAGRSRE